MNWNSTIGIISTFALFLPVFVILALKIIRYKNFLPLFIYCLLAFAYNLMTEGFVSVPKNTIKIFSIVVNLLDVPLMLLFLLMFTTVTKHIRRIKILVGVFICFELVVVAFKGINISTVTIVMGPGLAIVFGYALYFFVQTVKKSFIQNKAISKAVMASAICFAYGCFIIIYVLHYVLALPDVPNIFLIYFMVTIIYCSLLTAGLIMESKRLKKLEELLVTRKELQAFFADEKKTVVPKETTAQLKFN